MGKQKANFIGQLIPGQELMAAVTGAIWKCASSAENVERFQELGLIAVLIKILKENCDALDDLQFNPQKIDVLTNVVGAISGWLGPLIIHWSIT